MKVMKAWVLSLGISAMALMAMPAHAAQEVAGVKFEDQYTLAGQQLQLNGAGIRKMMIIKVYALGVYLPRKDMNPATALVQSGPKSIHVVMLRDVSAEKLTDALLAGVEANSTPTEFAQLKSRLNDFATGLRNAGEAKEGAVVKLEYSPATGTNVLNNGKVVVRDVPGEDFYRALMRIWLGEHPADRDLKARLLGTPN